MTNFCSDNVTGAAPEVLEALIRANQGPASAYGADAVTQRVETRLKEVFETDCAAFPVATGTAANALGLAVMTPPYGAVLCHRDAHINVDECGAPEFYAGGAKLLPLDGEHGRIAAATLTAALAPYGGDVHHVVPAALSLSQATESGTLYRPDEVRALAEIARGRGLGVQMDGARFANAVAALGCTPAEATWRAGVDVLAFGATKNGCLAAEAVVIFDPKLAESFALRRKRAGHLFSKQRFLSAQLEAYLADQLWLTNARHANAMAARLAEGLAALPGARLVHPVEANEIFIGLPEAAIAGLQQQGFEFHPWGLPAEQQIRLVTAWNTAQGDVDRLVAAAQGLCAAA